MSYDKTKEELIMEFLAEGIDIEHVICKGRAYENLLANIAMHNRFHYVNYDKMNFTEEQMLVLTQGVRKNIDIGWYANHDLPYSDMFALEVIVLKGIDIEGFIKEGQTINELYNAIIYGIAEMKKGLGME